MAAENTLSPPTPTFSCFLTTWACDLALHTLHKCRQRNDCAADAWTYYNYDIVLSVLYYPWGSGGRSPRRKFWLLKSPKTQFCEEKKGRGGVCEKKLPEKKFQKKVGGEICWNFFWVMVSEKNLPILLEKSYFGTNFCDGIDFCQIFPGKKTFMPPLNPCKCLVNRIETHEDIQKRNCVFFRPHWYN